MVESPVRMRRFWEMETDDCGAPSPCLKGSQPIGFDKRALSKEGVDDPELNPLTLPVDDPHLSEPPLLAFEEIVFQKERDLPGREGMEIDPILNRKMDRIRVFVFSPQSLVLQPFSYHFKYPMKHGLGQPAGLGVLLARVIGGN